MGLFSLEKLFGMTIRESATDGSDFTNPDADYRRLFLGEDGALHLKDSAGAVTAVGGSVAEIADLPTAETDTALRLAPDGVGGVEWAATGGTAANPELSDLVTGSTVDMSGAATGTGVTASASADLAAMVQYTDGTHQYWDVASAVGTGDFDYRCRVTAAYADVPAGTSPPLFTFGVTDGSRTTATFLGVEVRPAFPGATAHRVAGGHGLSITVDGIGPDHYQYPVVLRVRRVGTTVTFLYSIDNGRGWVTMGSTTSSLDVGKVGVWGHIDGNTSITIGVHYIKSA